MAGAQHTSTRRQVLGAAAALPVVASCPSTALRAVPLPRQAGGGTEEGRGRSFAVTVWDRALARFEAAAGELGAYERFCSGLPFKEQEALELGFDLRSDAMYGALRRLLRSPAPDLHALARKIDLIVRHDVGSLAGGEACLAALRRDARRLARDEPRRPAPPPERKSFPTPPRIRSNMADGSAPFPTRPELVEGTRP